MGKSGAPSGHKGVTHILDKPDEIIYLSIEKKIISDIPPPQKIRVTEYDLEVYRDSNCGMCVKSKHMDCPQEGKWAYTFSITSQC